MKEMSKTILLAILCMAIVAFITIMSYEPEPQGVELAE